jgi:predicted ArsR family transcriptional regulator
MSIQDTSLHSWYELQSKLGDRQKKVLDEIRKEPSTNAEIAARLEWPINCVTPRCKELREMGLVEDAGKVKCKATGRTAHLWQATQPIQAFPKQNVVTSQKLFS